MFVTQSFAKNMGLYGERVGALHVVTASQQQTTNVLSQLKQIIRASYSSPPIHGARIADRVLGSKENSE
jgi:aspartate/tyrosine/aromatic aminotransferase